MTLPAILAAALDYAGTGWPVFPCKPGGKAPLVEHGFKDATTHPDAIVSWWTRHPRANIGVATGAPGPDVLDVDVKAGLPGLQMMDRLRRAGLLRGASRIVQTPGGGYHMYYAGSERRGGAVRPGRSVEFKARGGYVLAPPGRTPAGEYIELDACDDAPALLDWDACRRLLAPPPAKPRLVRAATSDIGALARWLEGEREGNRNAALYWACCRAAEAGLAAAPLVAVAVAAGLPEGEARRTALSALQRTERRRP